MIDTLFLGNGLNRTLDNGLSWADLMGELGSCCRDDDDVPFPIEFEAIAAKQGCRIGARRTDPYKDLREKISRIIKKADMTVGKVHFAFRDLTISNVITTNYDILFESMFDASSKIGNPGSSRNILGPTHATSAISFFHAHGIASWKNTHCLGHEHYASLISKIRNEFKNSFENNSSEDEVHDFLLDLVTGEREPKGIWPELLFTSNVAIVGFGLDYSEIDIWWLLAMRTALFQPSGGLDKYANRIIYYQIDINSRKKTPYDYGKQEALNALGVEVQPIPADDFTAGYQDIARRIKECRDE